MIITLLGFRRTFSFAAWWWASTFVTSDDVLNQTKDHEAGEQVLNDGNAHALVVVFLSPNFHNILG